VVFKFGQFELDTQKRELRRGSGVRPVEPQVFNLLAFLIENRDRIVSRDELFDAIWHKRVVSDSVLASRINAARRAVDDDGKQQRIIRTLRKSGVRFVAAVADEATGISLKIPQVHRLAYDLSGAPSLGLLPFARVDASAQSRAIAAALGEETRFSLHSVDWLRVTAAQPSADSSHGLGGMMNLARYVLEGSVRIEADRCVIIARLTDTRTGVCLWSEKHGCDTHQVSTDVPRIAAGIARAVAEQIFAIERIRTRSIPARERSVWDAVVVTLSMINTRRKDSVRDAQALLAALVRSDVKSPAVFSLLSFTATLSVHLGWVSRKSLRERTFDLVGRALAVDDRDPWAHLALGYARLYMDNRPDEALGALQHALRLDPSLSMAHYLMALSFAYRGDTDAAFAEASIAERLSPLDLLAKGNAGAYDNVRATASFVAGRYRDGIHFAQRAVVVSPLQVPAYRQIVLNASFAGDMKVAASAMSKVRSIAPDLQRWLVESEPIWCRAEDYRKYVEAFRMAGHR
jgi:DNA-binding winged helix-turn-helix (wHTH) protein